MISLPISSSQYIYIASHISKIMKMPKINAALTNIADSNCCDLMVEMYYFLVAFSIG